jgi:rhodanese-related sulfurtransferase
MVGHIANAINIDVEGMQFNADVSKLDKTKTYAVYCHSGRRSGIATSEMSKLGFSKLFNLDGGIGAWSTAGQQLVTN